jgi:phage shock protein A
LTFQERLQLQHSELCDVVAKARSQEKVTLEQGREELAHDAFLRAERVEREAAGVAQRIEQMREQQRELELAARRLQEQAEAVLMQREVLRAKTTVAAAWAQMERTSDRRTGHTPEPLPGSGDSDTATPD